MQEGLGLVLLISTDRVSLEGGSAVSMQDAGVCCKDIYKKNGCQVNERGCLGFDVSWSSNEFSSKCARYLRRARFETGNEHEYLYQAGTTVILKAV